MKRSERDSINRLNVNTVRSTSESEDIDLAAEATEGAPAQSLAPAGKGRRSAARKPATRKRSGR